MTNKIILGFIFLFMVSSAYALIEEIVIPAPVITGVQVNVTCQNINFTLANETIDQRVIIITASLGNWSADKLNYYNITQVDNLISGNISLSLSNYYNKSQTDSKLDLKLNVTDQRYNDTILIQSLDQSINLSNYVLYENATRNVNLGNKNITTTGKTTTGNFEVFSNSTNPIRAVITSDTIHGGNSNIGFNFDETGYTETYGSHTRWAMASFNNGHTNRDFTFWNAQLALGGFLINGDTNDITFGGKIIKSGGTSTQFLKADGSVNDYPYGAVGYNSFGGISIGYLEVMESAVFVNIFSDGYKFMTDGSGHLTITTDNSNLQATTYPTTPSYYVMPNVISSSVSGTVSFLGLTYRSDNFNTFGVTPYNFNPQTTNYPIVPSSISGYIHTYGANNPYYQPVYAYSYQLYRTNIAPYSVSILDSNSNTDTDVNGDGNIYDSSMNLIASINYATGYVTDETSGSVRSETINFDWSGFETNDESFIDDGYGNLVGQYYGNFATIDYGSGAITDTTGGIVAIVTYNTGTDFFYTSNDYRSDDSFADDGYGNLIGSVCGNFATIDYNTGYVTDLTGGINYTAAISYYYVRANTNSITATQNIDAKSYSVNGVLGLTDNYDSALGGQVAVTGGIVTGITDDPSDKAFKDKVSSLSLDTNKFFQLKPSEWNWTGLGKTGKGYGLVAQDLESVYPQLVKQGQKITIYYVNISKLISFNQTVYKLKEITDKKEIYKVLPSNTSKGILNKDIVFKDTKYYITIKTLIPKTARINQSIPVENITTYKTIDYAGVISLQTLKIQELETFQDKIKDCIKNSADWKSYQECVSK